MKLETAKPGDIVLIDRRGEHYYAELRVKGKRWLTVRPLNHRLARLPSFQQAKSREVVGLWHKSKRGMRATGATAIKEEL